MTVLSSTPEAPLTQSADTQCCSPKEFATQFRASAEVFVATNYCVRVCELPSSLDTTSTSPFWFNFVIYKTMKSALQDIQATAFEIADGEKLCIYTDDSVCLYECTDGKQRELDRPARLVTSFGVCFPSSEC